MLATQLAQMGVDTRIIDKMPHPVLRGHADGLHARTCEVFDAMGIYGTVRDEGMFWKETCMWDCSGEKPRLRQRTSFDFSVFSHIKGGLLGQAVVERNFLQEMEKRESRP